MVFAYVQRSHQHGQCCRTHILVRLCDLSPFSAIIEIFAWFSGFTDVFREAIEISYSGRLTQICLANTVNGGIGYMEIRESDFEEMVLQSDRPVLVHFWAVWDQSSRMMQSIVDRLSLAVEDWADVYFVNVDRSSLLAEKYEVRGVPTFVVFADGTAIGRKTGTMTEEQMIQLLKKAEQAMPLDSEPENNDDEGMSERAA
jgi:thioredoxin 1